MKKAVIFFFVLCSALIINAQTSPVGLWNTGRENTKIEIKEAGEQLEGTIFSSDNKEAIVGKVIIRDLQKEGEVYKGQLYAAKRGIWTDATFDPQGQKLLVTISSGWRKKTIAWEAAR